MGEESLQLEKEEAQASNNDALCCLSQFTQTVLSKETWNWARCLGLGLDEVLRL